MSEPAILWGETIAPIVAGTTAVYTGYLQDATGAPIPPANLNSLSLTIRDTLTGSIINGVQNINILNTGRGALSQNASGTLLTCTLVSGDTGAFNATQGFEIRSLFFSWTFNNASGQGFHQADFQITVPPEP